MELINTILEKMSNVFKPQRKFISVLLATVMLMRGNVNFRNMSRYSVLSEKTFSRQFRNPSDFAKFNNLGTEMIVNPDTSLIAATDCSFIPESGRHTYALAKFYNGARSEAGKGLEISELAVADVNYNTAYSVSISDAGYAHRRAYNVQNGTPNRDSTLPADWHGQFLFCLRLNMQL